jgi:hypothetical protein
VVEASGFRAINGFDDDSDAALVAFNFVEQPGDFAFRMCVAGRRRSRKSTLQILARALVIAVADQHLSRHVEAGNVLRVRGEELIEFGERGIALAQLVELDGEAVARQNVRRALCEDGGEGGDFIHIEVAAVLRGLAFRIAGAPVSDRGGEWLQIESPQSQVK